MGDPLQVCKPCSCPALRKKKESGDTDGVVKMCLWSNISEAKGPGTTCQRVRQAEEQTGPDCHLCN